MNDPKPRMSTRFTNPRLSIYTTRQPPAVNNVAQWAQRRQTRGVLSTNPLTLVASTNDTTKVKKEFVKPTQRLLNTNSIATQSKLPVATTSSSSFQCKYCDKSFAKSIGLNQHLSTNCEKIPASHRRLILKEETDQAEIKTRKKKSDNLLSLRVNDQMGKHSTFFSEKINQVVTRSNSVRSVHAAQEGR